MIIRVKTKMLGVNFERTFTNTTEATDWMKILCDNHAWFDVDHIRA